MFKLFAVLVFMCLSHASEASKVVLIIQPGSLLGYTSSLLLEELTKTLPQPLDANFDLIGGCSTGGIIASLMRVKDEFGNNKFSALDITEKYLGLGPIIFNPMLDRQQRTDELKNALESSLGQVKLSSIREPIAIFALKSKGVLDRDQIGKINQIDFDKTLVSLAEKKQQSLPPGHNFTKAEEEVQLLSLLIKARLETRQELNRESFLFDNSYPVLLYQAVLASAAKGAFEPVHLAWDGSDGINTFDDAAGEGFDTTMATVAYAKKIFPGEDLVVIDIGIKESNENVDYALFLQKQFPDLTLRYFALTPEFKCDDFHMQYAGVQEFFQKNPDILNTVKTAIIK